MMMRRSMASSHVIYTLVFPILAVALALVAIAILSLRFWEPQCTLTVAVGPKGGADAELIAAAARRLDHDRAAVRLAIRTVDGPAEAAKALQSGDADLAVIRTDVAIPGNGATVGILHSDVAVLAAARGSAVTKPAGLSGKRAGIIPASADNAALFDAVLAEYEIAASTVQHVMLAADELPRAVADKKIDALFAVGPMRGPSVDKEIAALMSGKRDPVLIPIDAAEGMAARGAAYQKIDLPNGFFPGSPPLPDDDFATLGVAVRLDARATLANQTVTDLTKRLFEMRRSLEAEAPIAASIEKPDSDKGSFETVHPGASAYFGDNEKSFLDLYGDWIYIGAMAFSGLGSATAAMIGMTRARARKDALALICRLIEVKQNAHQSTSLPRLIELDREIEELSTMGLLFARAHNFDEAGLVALRLAIDEARRAVDDRANELRQNPALIANAAAPSPLHSISPPRS
jgi:TRAP transporter TAXI family solute receptor